MFVLESCHTRNTDVFFQWKSYNEQSDADIVELFYCLDNPAVTIYRGKGSQTSFDVGRYNQTVYARLYSVNISGISESSEILTLKTSKGEIFDEMPPVDKWTIVYKAVAGADSRHTTEGECKLILF